jgi:hypothetical protein
MNLVIGCLVYSGLQLVCENEPEKAVISLESFKVKLEEFRKYHVEVI